MSAIIAWHFCFCPIARPYFYYRSIVDTNTAPGGFQVISDKEAESRIAQNKASAFCGGFLTIRDAVSVWNIKYGWEFHCIGLRQT